MDINREPCARFPSTSCQLAQNDGPWKFIYETRNGLVEAKNVWLDGHQ